MFNNFYLISLIGQIDIIKFLQAFKYDRKDYQVMVI